MPGADGSKAGVWRGKLPVIGLPSHTDPADSHTVSCSTRLPGDGCPFPFFVPSTDNALHHRLSHVVVFVGVGGWVAVALFCGAGVIVSCFSLYCCEHMQILRCAAVSLSHCCQIGRA